MQNSTPPSSQRTALSSWFREPLIFGTLCGLVAAVGYTGANACLRAVANCDPVWVSCVKAVPTVALFGPMLLVRLLRGQEALPTWRQMKVLLAAALACQLLGNVVFQWSLGVIGMAVTIPLALGTMIIGAAVLGRLILHESVTVAMACSLLILVSAVVVLSLGADKATESAAQSRGVAYGGQVERERQPEVLPGEDMTTRAPAPVPEGGISESSAAVDGAAKDIGRVLAGVGAACLSGLAYALLGVAIRLVVTDKMSVSMTMVTVTLTGVVALGMVSLWTPGLQAIRNTSSIDFWFMMLAGLFNAAAFLALTKSLQLVPVAYVNALNASQAAMGALAGILLFAEPSSWLLWLGVALTALGLLLMRRPQAASTKLR